MAFWTQTLNAANNMNRENARIKMEASSAGKLNYGNEGTWVKYQVLGAFWLLDLATLVFVLSCHAVEAYEMFISLLVKPFSGCGKPRITEILDAELVDMGARLYFILTTGTALNSLQNYTCFPTLLSAVLCRRIHKIYCYILRCISK
jgi:hypothetical protein